MRLNMDRICQLAGISGPVSSVNRSRMLKENVDYNEELYEEAEGVEEAEEAEGVEKEVEIDEVMLVQELRRARRLMNESRKREAAKKEKLQEMQLRAVIDQEVKNVIKDLQLNSGWVYGNNKPTRSRKGYTHQGSYLKGIGFK